MWMQRKFAAGLIAATVGVVGFVATPAMGAVTYEFGGKGSTFDGETSVDVPLTDSATGLSTIMTVDATGGTLNSNAGDLGVDDDLIQGTSEAIGLTFDKTVELVELDLGRVGSDASDGADVTIGTFSQELHTAATISNGSYNGNTNVWTLGTPIEIVPGTALNLTGTQGSSEIDLEAGTFNVTPEPASAALVGLGGLAMLAGRRKRRA